MSQIETLFKKYVPGKIFHPEFVTTNSKDSRIIYKFDGVYILHHSRQTFCYDDYDIFTDIIVEIDGNRVYHMEKDNIKIDKSINKNQDDIKIDNSINTNQDDNNNLNHISKTPKDVKITRFFVTK